MFIDRIDISRGHYILSLNDEELRAEIYDPDEINENGGAVNFENYIKSVKKFITLLLLNKGELKRSYKFSNKLKICGRRFVKGFGVQTLQHKLRGFLVHNKYYDFDMKNAHPTILKYLLKKYNSSLKTPNLDRYIEKRENMLKKYNASKKDILIALNCDNPVRVDNLLVKSLDKEFKKIQTFFYGLTEFNHLKEDKKNKKGSLLNKILCITENEILEKAQKELGDVVEVLMFDGFLVNNKVNIEETLKKLDISTADYGIKWIYKKHDDTIKMDDDSVIPYNDIENYETVKLKFETNHFIIKTPLLFGIEKMIKNKKTYYFYNKGDFQNLTATFKYTAESCRGLESKNFFNEWIQDPKRREYDKLDFIPCDDIPDDIYNIFGGFDYEGKKPEGHPIIEDFLNHLDLLVNYEKNAHQYLIKYIAHLIQKPEELPRTALIFKSGQGVGKDMMIDYIEKMLGTEYIYRTADLNQVFGNFNGGLKNKLILQLNELQGADGYSNKENLKDLITAPHKNINEKNMKPYTETNYIRIIIFSNNLSPVEIPHDDRRYCVFKCGKKKSKLYYNKMYDYLRNPEALEQLTGFFKEVDIKEYEPTDRPITTAYNDMKESNLHPIYKYLYELFKTEEFKTEFEDSIKTHKKTGLICVPPEDFRSGFKYYLENNGSGHIRHDYKTLKLLLNDLGVLSKEIKIGGCKNRKNYYMINRPDLIELLESKGLKTAEEEYEEDEFE